jgi:hypothetical protein
MTLRRFLPLGVFIIALGQHQELFAQGTTPVVTRGRADLAASHLVIDGANFEADTQVFLGHEGGTYQLLPRVSGSPNVVTVALPAGVAGSYSVVVQTKNKSATLNVAMAVRGPRGEQGEQGEPGPQGAVGPVGEQGLQGDLGPQGLQGLQGTVGPQGTVGQQGERGLQGVQGFQGSQGLQGHTGAQGPRGLTWKGAWDSVPSYATNEAVQHDGTAWIALRDNTNVTPVGGDDWSLLALGVTSSCQVEELVTWNGTAWACTARPFAVTSVVGTAGQIDATASGANVTLALPSTVNVNISGTAANALSLDGMLASAFAHAVHNHSNYVAKDGDTMSGTLTAAELMVPGSGPLAYGPVRMGSNNGVCGVNPTTDTGATEHGVFVESAQGECGGFYADGDVAIIVSAGDPDLLRVYDEDFPTGRPQFAVDGFGNIRVGSWSTGCVRTGSGTVVAGTCASDERLKRDARPMGNVLDRVIQFQPMHYQWRGAEFPTRGIGDGEDIGLIAQDVEKVMPEMVVQDTEGFRAVHYERLPMLLLQSVRELKSENDALKRLLTEQETRLRALEAASVRQPR